MFTIGQFAKICNVSQKALRYYEKIELLLPDKVDEWNQYRYYSKRQISVVRTILLLKDLDIPLKTIKAIVVDGMPAEEVNAVLHSQRQMLINTISGCTAKIFKLNHWNQYQEEEEMKKTNCCLGLQMVPEVHVRAIRKISTNFPADIQLLFATLMQEITSDSKVLCAGAPMVVYYDEEFNPEKVDFEAAWPVSDEAFANKTYPECVAVVCTFVGPYDQLCSAYEAAFSWINENDYKQSGPMRDVYLNDPTVIPPEQLVTQVIVPVKKK